MCLKMMEMRMNERKKGMLFIYLGEYNVVDDNNREEHECHHTVYYEI